MITHNRNITIAGGAIFSAVSIVFAITLTPIVPRLAWGIALIDPVSIIWVLCFILFGFTAGLICSTVGFLSLFLVDPFIPWGPIFKIMATLPLIIIPYLMVKHFLGSKDSNGVKIGYKFKSIRRYIISSIPAVTIRCVLMVIANILFMLFLLPGFIELNGGLLTVTLVVVGINIEQSIWDLLIPWVIAYPTGVYDMYSFW